MPLFSAGMRAALGKLNARPVPIFTAAWPGETMRCTGDGGQGLGGLPLLPRLFGADGVSFAASLHPGALEFPEASVVLSDKDRRITRILEGGTDPKGSLCSLAWGARGVVPADWHVLFTGTYQRKAYEDGGRNVRLFLRALDAPFQGNVPKAPLLQSEAPKALATSRGIYLPLIYGIHSAEALTGRGMVPAINWSYDTPNSAWRYVLALGVLKEVARVYKNGTLLTLTMDYLITHPVIGGKTITSIDLVAAPGEDAVITADVTGYERVGDGSGEPILNPVEQLQHRLVNFMLSDCRGGAWVDPSTVAVNLASFAEAAAFAAEFGFEGSGYLGGTAQPTGIDADLSAWLNSWLPFRIFWSEGLGKVGLRPFDHRHPGYISSPFFRAPIHEIGASFKPEDDGAPPLRRVDLSYLPGAADSKLWSSLVVEDVSVTDETGTSFNLTHSAARIL